MKRLCPSPALVVACLALTFAVAGTGYAALKLPKNSVTTVQVKDFSLLRRDFKAGQLPTAGSGVAARWAHVRADGRLLAQSGGVSVNHVDVGHYLVDFGAAVTGKAIVASPSRFGDLDPRGEVLAGPCGGEPEGASARRATTRTTFA